MLMVRGLPGSPGIIALAGTTGRQPRHRDRPSRFRACQRAGRGRTKPASIFPTSIVPVPVITTGSPAANARTSSSHLDDFIATREVAFGLWFTGTAQVNPVFRAELDQMQEDIGRSLDTLLLN
jgi:hypothetical protein